MRFYEGIIKGLNAALEHANTSKNNKCPHCGSNDYQELYKIATDIALVRIYEDGELVSEDPNVYKIRCHCLNCDKDFYKQGVDQHEA